MSKISSMDNLKNQLGKLGENVWTIPNILSMLRIIAIPFFVYFFLSEHFFIAVSIIFVSGLTDLFDGKIARHFNQISELGKLLDPAADKLTQITVTLVYFKEFRGSEDQTLRAFSFVFLLFIIKEVTMIICSFILLSMNIIPEPAIIYGKVATFAFYIVMGLLMLFAPHFGALSKFWIMPHALILILVTISATLTIVAFFSYIPDTLRKLKAKKNDLEDTQ